MEIVLAKAGDCLVPFDDAARQFIDKMKAGALTRADYKQVRNYQFHKKYFCLVDFAFHQWEPPGGLEYQGQPVRKTLNRFRKDVAILAGFFDTTVNLRGDVRLEAKSISFAQMDAIDFERLYSATIDVVLSRILRNYTRADLDNVVATLLARFD
jgi:hypothetical protein